MSDYELMQICRELHDMNKNIVELIKTIKSNRINVNNNNDDKKKDNK